MNRKKTLEEQVGLIAEVKTLRDTASKEGREFTGEEKERWDTANDRLSAIETDLQRDDAILDLERRQRERAGQVVEGQPETRRVETPERQPASTDNENRAFRFYIGDESEENRDAFGSYGCSLNFEEGKRDMMIDMLDTRNVRAQSYRAQSVGIDTAGGYTVPEGFVPSLERALLDFGGMREEAEIIRTATGNDLPWPTADDTSNKGIEIAENTAVSEQDVAFKQTIWYAIKYTSKMVKVSAELMQDSAFDLPSILGSMLGERLGRITNERYTTGTGTNQPEGITVGSTAGVTAVAVDAITADELIDLQHSVDPAYRDNGRFMFNDTTLRNIRKLKDGNGQYLWQPGLQSGVPGVILGQGYRINQDMPAMTTGLIPVVYGDLTKYKIRDIQAIRFRRLIERYAESDQEAFVAFFRTDGKLLDAGTNPVKKITMA